MFIESVLRLPVEMIQSEAFGKLTGKSPHVLLLLLCKAKGNRPITFSYSEAKREYGISPARFLHAVEQTIKFGFVDCVKQGGSTSGAASLYRISNRWESFGTDGFKARKRLLAANRRKPPCQPVPRRAQGASTYPYVNDRGYRVVRHPRTGRSVLEHRFVYEQTHGTLLPGWNVHHINGNKLDNSPSNLKALPRCEHVRQHR
jgi:hypothetical protein